MVSRFPILAATVLAATLTVGQAPALADSDYKRVLEQARALEAKGDLAAAVIELKKAVRNDPERGELRLELGRGLLRQGDAKGAEAELRRARQAGIADGKVLPLLAQAWVGQGKIDQVVKEARLADGTPEDKARVQSIRALALLATNKKEEAAREIDAARTLAPDLAEARLAAAQIAAADGRVADAEALIDPILAADGNNFEALVMKSRLRRGQNDPDGALVLADKAHGIRPGSPSALLARAPLLLLKGRDKEGMADLDKVLKASPNNAEAKLIKAGELFRRNQEADAWTLIQPAMPALTNNPAAQVLAAVLNLKLNNAAQARSFAEAALAKAPDNTIALRILAEINMRAKTPAKAIPMLEKLVVNTPDDAPTLEQMARAYAAVGRNDDAARTLEKAIKLKPDEQNLKVGLGMAKINSGDIAGAESVLADAKSPEAAATMAILNMRRGELDKAKSSAESYRQQLPASPLPEHLLARISLAQGNLAATESHLKAALGKDAAFISAAQDLASLYRRQGRKADESKAYDDILKREPANEPALLGRINMAWREVDEDRAAKLAADAVAAQPSSVALTGTHVDLLIRSGKFEDAVAAADRLVTFAGGQPQAHIILGRARVVAGQRDAGIAEYRRAVELAPNAAAPRVTLAQALVALRRPDEARPIIEDAIRVQPTSREAWQMLLMDELQRRGPEAAVKLARTAGDKIPNGKPLADLLAGEVLVAAKNDKEALGPLKVAYDTSPEMARIVLPQLYSAMRRAGNPAGAKALLTGWLDKRPDDLGARLLLAGNYLDEKDKANAIREYEAILRVDPDSLVALNNLATLLGPGAGQKGVEMAHHAFMLSPANASVADTYGWLLSRSGNTREALRVLSRAQTADSGKSPSISYHLAATLADGGEKGRAIDILKPLLGVSFEEQSEAQALYKKLGGT